MPLRSFLARTFLMAVSFLYICQAQATDAGDVPWRGLITDSTYFSPQGNQEVISRYQDFLDHGSQCQVLGHGKRVLLTGFGLFVGVDFNISGGLIDNFTQASIWPDSVSTSRAWDNHNQNKAPRSGTLSAADHGGRVINRHMVINSQEYSVCLFVVDVMWDFAGAAISAQLERFQPDLVVMDGQGIDSVILEEAAQNVTTNLSGFYSSGKPAEDNTPVSQTIDSTHDSEFVRPMTWNNQKLARRISPLIKDIGYVTDVPQAHSRGNDYVCNNISYVVLSAASGDSIKLAGDQLTLNPYLEHEPQIGFMHLPTIKSISVSDGQKWARVYANLIDEALNTKR